MMSRQPRGPPRRRLVGADARGSQIGARHGDINVDEIGPVDYLVVGFPADKANFSGEMASQLNGADRQQHIGC